MLRNRYLDLEAFIVDDCYSCCYMVPSFFFFLIKEFICVVFMFGLGLFMVISFTWRNCINNPLL